MNRPLFLFYFIMYALFCHEFDYITFDMSSVQICSMLSCSWGSLICWPSWRFTRLSVKFEHVKLSKYMILLSVPLKRDTYVLEAIGLMKFWGRFFFRLLNFYCSHRLVGHVFEQSNGAWALVCPYCRNICIECIWNILLLKQICYKIIMLMF